MEQPAKRDFMLKQLIYITTLLLFTIQAKAEIVTKPDGRYNGASEGYSKEFLVDFSASSDFSPSAQGLLSFGQNTAGDWLLYFQAPLGYVDNSYGMYQSSDWQKGNSGQRREHTFEHLIKSDMLGENTPLTLKTNTGNLDVRADYLRERYSADGSLTGFEAALLNTFPSISVASSLEYNLRNLSGEFLNAYSGAGKKKRGENTNSDSPLVNSPYSVDFADTDDWVFHVGYEFIIGQDYFSGDDWLTQTQDDMLISMGNLHASPPKREYLNSGGYSYCQHDGMGGCGISFDSDMDSKQPVVVNSPYLFLSTGVIMLMLFGGIRMKKSA
jgi:hypothetical protein